jgi:glycosyltransferase involved in cell wall biosynthesis
MTRMATGDHERSSRATPVPAAALLLAGATGLMTVFALAPLGWLHAAALPMALLVPGYALLLAIFGPRARLDLPPALALSLMLTLTIYALLALGLYAFSTPLSRGSVLAGTDALIALLLAAALGRTWALPTVEWPAPDISSRRALLRRVFPPVAPSGQRVWRRGGWAAGYLAAAALSGLALFIASGYLPKPVDPPFTQFYLAWWSSVSPIRRIARSSIASPLRLMRRPAGLCVSCAWAPASAGPARSRGRYRWAAACIIWASRCTSGPPRREWPAWSSGCAGRPAPALPVRTPMADRPLSILMVSDFYPPHLGGAERAVADLGAELSERGHRVWVATLWHESLARRERDGLVEVHRLQGMAGRLPFLHSRPDRPFHPPIADPLLSRQLRGLIARLKPDVVHGHTWMFCSALPHRRALGFAAVATLHDYALLCPKKTLMHLEERPCPYHLGLRCPGCARRHYGTAKGLVTTAALWAGRGAYRGVDTFIAISSYMAEMHARDAALAPARIVTIPGFVRDELLRRPAGPPLPDLPAEYMLLDAYRRMETSVPLVLIGPRQPDAPASLPPGVVVRPGSGHDEIIRAMDHCRFLVSPALWPEPFGLVAIEAMARGKALVASRAGGALDIVRDGETGLLVSPGDAQALAHAMRNLLGRPALAARLGRSGAARCAACFSAGAVVPTIEEVYRQACRHAQCMES